MIKITPDFPCIHCGACAKACSHGVIKMVPNEEGKLIPRVSFALPAGTAAPAAGPAPSSRGKKSDPPIKNFSGKYVTLFPDRSFIKGEGHKRQTGGGLPA